MRIVRRSAERRMKAANAADARCASDAACHFRGVAVIAPLRAGENCGPGLHRGSKPRRGCRAAVLREVALRHEVHAPTRQKLERRPQNGHAMRRSTCAWHGACLILIAPGLATRLARIGLEQGRSVRPGKQEGLDVGGHPAPHLFASCIPRRSEVPASGRTRNRGDPERFGRMPAWPMTTLAKRVHPRPHQRKPHAHCPAVSAWRRGTDRGSSVAAGPADAEGAAGRCRKEAMAAVPCSAAADDGGAVVR